MPSPPLTQLTFDIIIDLRRKPNRADKERAKELIGKLRDVGITISPYCGLLLPNVDAAPPVYDAFWCMYCDAVACMEPGAGPAETQQLLTSMQTFVQSMGVTWPKPRCTFLSEGGHGPPTANASTVGDDAATGDAAPSDGANQPDAMAVDGVAPEDEAAAAPAPVATADASPADPSAAAAASDDLQLAGSEADAPSLEPAEHPENLDAHENLVTLKGIDVSRVPFQQAKLTQSQPRKNEYEGKWYWAELSGFGDPPLVGLFKQVNPSTGVISVRLYAPKGMPSGEQTKLKAAVKAALAQMAQVAPVPSEDGA